MAQDSTGIPLRQLAERCGVEFAGDGDVVIERVAPLDAAGRGAIAFLSGPRYRGHLSSTRASAVIVMPGDAAATTLPRLITTNPYAAYARVAPSATIGPRAVIGERTAIGEKAQIGAGVVIAEDCDIGQDCVLHPNVVVYAHSSIGARSIVHGGAVIGADGFGMAEHEGRWIKVPQLGHTVIGVDVEIGANTTIDRGAIGDTVIEDDVKLDNQIQIGHNCRIGAHTAIAGCAGIAGSTIIGRNCKIGGAAMIAGHLDIADGTVIAAATALADSTKTAGIYTGAFPALPQREWMRLMASLRRLHSLFERVRALERATKQGES